MTTTCFFRKNNRNDLQPLLHAIESDHGAIEHPNSIGRHIEWLRTIISQRRLKPLRRIVAKITDCASGERHETRSTRQRPAAEIVSDPFSRKPRIRLGFAGTLDNRLHPLATHDHLGPGAEKRITRNPFTTFNRLQQKRVLRIPSDTHKRADRSVQIREHRAHDGHHVALSRLALKRLKSWWLKLEHLFIATKRHKSSKD